MDNSAELVAIARAAVPRARFIHKSIYDAEIPACEAILAVGEPLLAGRVCRAGSRSKQPQSTAHSVLARRRAFSCPRITSQA